MRVGKAFETRVLTVTGQRVLGQVVGADGEEIDFGGQLVGHNDRRRRLNHNADLDTLVEVDALAAQLAFGFFKNPLGVAYLLHRGDHGQHNGDVAVC